MKAWLELDRVGGDVVTPLRAWQRVPIARSLWVCCRAAHDEEVADLEVSPRRTASAIFEVSPVRERFFMRTHRRDVWRNGVLLRQSDRYVLENGDLIQVARGTWLRFLDDSVPLPLPRLRRQGRAFLFSPTPTDDADAWRAWMPDRDALLSALRIDDAHDDELVTAAFPAVVEVLATPAGRYALAVESAGVPLPALIDRTRRDDARLDRSVVDAINHATAAAVHHALAHGWTGSSATTREVLLTWEGRVRWCGFLPPPATSWQSDALERAWQRLRDTSGEREGMASEAEVAALLVNLFPEEHAAEMRLREEAAVLSRDDLDALEKATRGRAAP